MADIIKIIQELSKKQKIGLISVAGGLSSYASSKISSHLMKNSDNDNLQKIGTIGDKYAIYHAIGSGIITAAAAHRLKKKKEENRRINK